MAFVVNTFVAAAGDRSGTVYEMTDEEAGVRAEVWPHWGFNCLRWQLRRRDGSWADLLFCAPDWETNPVPTRSGHPILFPFPGRLRDGTLRFQGKTWQLPLNDSTKTHAIHGFTPRNPWRVTDWNGDAEWAFVTGQFRLSKDLPDQLSNWPADFALDATYQLFRDKLRVTAKVENRGSGPLPFGLGYHGYFRLPGVADPDVGGHILQANADQWWEVDAANLPTGWRPDVPAEVDFRTPRPIGATALDHVFTNVTAKPDERTALVELAVLSHDDAPRRLRVLADPAFRELVLFTPPHRQAVAVEPYTCSADAGNLWDRGVDSGWRVLEAGGEWEGVVEYRWEAE
ncbi:MAG: aldose 1-epimerase [Gemmataceae bacterium]|nr:aldose 1-epimerase [Gemmataceae bacterium]